MRETNSLNRSYAGQRLESKAVAASYAAIRQASEALCEPLEPEDCCIQSIPDVSPTKWHLAHTSWFFETFVLKPGLADYRSPNPLYEFLFNN